MKNDFVDNQPSVNSKAAAWALLLILVVAFGVRLHGLQRQSYSMDEVFELQLARKSAEEIVIEADGFPPLYNLLLHSLFGAVPDDRAGRWLSLVLGVLTVLVVWRFAHDIGGTGTAIFAAAFLAVMPIHIWYSKECRAYALVMFAAALVWWLGYRAVDRGGWRRYLLFSAAALLGLYTHYFFVFVIAIPLLTLCGQFRQLQLPPLMTVASLLAVGLLPLMLLLPADFDTQANWPDETSPNLQAVLYGYYAMFSGFALGPSKRELHVLEARAAIQQVLPWVITLAVALLPLMKTATELIRTRWGFRLAVLMLSPIIVAVPSVMFDVSFHVRYVVWTTIPIAIGIGWCYAQTPLANRCVSIVILAVLFTTSLANRHWNPRYQTEDVRAASQFLASTPAAEQIVVVSGYMSTPLRYYLDDSPRVRRIPYGTPDEHGPAALQQLLFDVSPGGRRFWFVYSRPFHRDKDGAKWRIVGDFAGLSQVEQFAGIDIYEAQPK